jgi:glutamate dehydrogenase
MPASALVERMLEMVAQRGAPNGTNAEIFEAFVRAVTPQVRSAFMDRYPLELVFDVLASVFSAAQSRPDDDPVVLMHTGETGTAVITQVPDQPFLVDTVLLILRNTEIVYRSGFNLVVGIGRDPDGQMITIDCPGDRLESLIFVDAEPIKSDRVEDGKTLLMHGLRLAQAIVADFHRITSQVDEAAYLFARMADKRPDQAEAFREAAAFLRWLLSDNFVFMAAHQGDERFGTTGDRVADLRSGDLTDGWDSDDERPIRVRKSQEESPVHRAGRMDEIRIELPTDPDDETTPLLLQGLFTYRAVTQPSRHVPLLRQRLSRILRSQDSKPGSYRYKGIANVFDSLPTEFLFTAQSDEIAAMIDRVLEAEQEQQARVHVLQRPADSTAFVLVALPRGHWSEQLRIDIQDVLVSSAGATYCDHGVFVGRYDTMLVHFYLTGTSELSEEDIETLSLRVSELATSWKDRILAGLRSRFDGERAEELIRRYSSAFEEIYIRQTSPDQTVRDIEMLEVIHENNPVLVDFYVDERGRPNLRIYQLHNILLSEILPVLEHFGLVVLDQFADPVTANRSPPMTIDTFRLQGVRQVDEAVLLEHTAELIDGIEAVFTHDMVDDPLNRLLLVARLPWRAVELIRGYLGYARQLDLRYTRTRVREILLAKPELASNLWNYFHTRFDPNLSGDRTRAIGETAEAFHDRLREVSDHDTDVVFRTIFNLMESTLRTNFYRQDRTEHYISFKVDCALVRQMPPEPRMRYEIYVHHREMEGVHLRGGEIARGGIRWSDREDYRREIHGLATTQVLKNVLIVPEGAKGGFFLKHLSNDQATRRQDADRLYQILIRGLLDLTDNYVDGEIVHPPDVVRHDGNDPYLVVAADKGTAHLSDTANGLSEEYGFWLGDAFASGGSFGYDHKKVGITARGAWKTARRHFAEMGLDPDSQPFTAAGIGDPSGDVFGNGMIETAQMKLVAAFNHRHVFIDPDPDPAKTHAERLRLFGQVKGWGHYDTSLLSEGGGIFSRQAKSISLTPQIKDLLGVMSDELPVDAVIRLILRLDVDLLWNGGIGTYVKASNETHTDAGDTASDDVRVNADELRCKIMAEGGNLGFTQAGRVEFAKRGGRINTDAIDNSGGVDMSDHEVNLKILLNPIVASGKLEKDARDALLESLTEVVAEQVLDNLNTHAHQLSLDQIRSLRDPMFFSRTMDWVCRRSNTSRAALTLPSDDDLNRRAQARQGLTRPELAVIAAHVKTHIFKDLVRAGPSDIPGMEGRVRGYFPSDIRKQFSEAIDAHMLYRSIGMTVLTTDIVGDAGVLFFPMIQEWTNSSAVETARAWVLAMDLINARQIRTELEQCKATLDAQYKAWIEVQSGIAGLCAFALSPGQTGLVDEPLETIREVLKLLPKLRGAAHQAELNRGAAQHTARDIPQAVALRVATMTKLTIAREIALLHATDQRLSHTVIRYISIGEATGILPALRGMRIQQTSGAWEQVAMAILRNRLFLLMRELFESVPIGPEVRLGVNRVRRRLIRRGPLGSLAAEMDEVLGTRPNIPKLLVAEERIRAQLATGALSVPDPDEAPVNGKKASNGRASKTSKGTKDGDSQPKAST